MIKKFVCIFFDFLTLIFMLAAYLMQYYTKRKLGMLRWVNFKNLQFEKNIYFSISKYIFVIITLVSVFIIYKKYKNKKKLQKTEAAFIFELVIFETAYVFITLLLSPKIIPAYNFIMLCFLGVCIIQIIKNFLLLKLYENKK